MKLREKTTATLLIAIFMISTLSVISIGAPADGYTEAVLNAGDRLVEMQNDDGGFMWQVTGPPTPTTSSTNIIGVTAIGILEAHKLLDKPEYETALAKTYKFVVDKAPVYTGSDETTKGVDSWPDITFLIELADAAGEDASLLTAINSEVSGTTVAGIAALAKARYDVRLVAKGPSVTQMANWILGFRVAYPGYGFWEVRSIVKACLSLESYYPNDGYGQQAIDAAVVIHTNLDGGTYPFYIGDETQMYYVIGISGAIEAFSELELYPAKTLEMTELLIAYQTGDGYWDAGEDAGSGEESVQSTAYAVMALLAQGSGAAKVAASKGGDWLVSTQDTTGGWDPCHSTGVENLEVNSEAAWALSGLVKPTHEYICVWWLEDAIRRAPDGTELSRWYDDRIPEPQPVGYIEFKVTGRAYHGSMEWFYNYWPLDDFESSPLVIANGKFSAWARYTSPRSGLPILDKIRGKLTIGGGTAEGAYVQHSYAFGTESNMQEWYPDAVETDELGMWYLGSTDYTVHGQE